MHWIALQPQPEEDGSHSASDRRTIAATDWGNSLAALGWWALQFTPKVVWLDTALLLEVSASERLWGGSKGLWQKILQSSKPVPIVRYARGTSALVAAARLADEQLVQSAVDDLPLCTLAPARPHLDVLERIGCHTWGQLRALPRAGVARRFGTPLLAALDVAYGLRPEIYPWLQLPDVFDTTLELNAAVETAPALVFAARRMLESLRWWLQLRQRGVLALALRWTMETRRNAANQAELVLRCAQATQDMAHLQYLLLEQLARTRLIAPALGLRLTTLETQIISAETRSLLSDEQRSGGSLQQLLERLGARLGQHRVLQMHLTADHRPECMQRWSPALDAQTLTGAEPDSVPDNHQLYPTWLLATPLPLAVQTGQLQCHGPLTLLAGPQRLEAAGWSDGKAAARDYFLARSEQMGLLWIFRQRTSLASRWYLHGLFG